MPRGGRGCHSPSWQPKLTELDELRQTVALHCVLKEGSVSGFFLNYSPLAIKPYRTQTSDPLRLALVWSRAPSTSNPRDLSCLNPILSNISGIGSFKCERNYLQQQGPLWSPPHLITHHPSYSPELPVPTSLLLHCSPLTFFPQQGECDHRVWVSVPWVPRSKLMFGFVTHSFCCHRGKEQWQQNFSKELFASFSLFCAWCGDKASPGPYGSSLWCGI